MLYSYGPLLRKLISLIKKRELEEILENSIKKIEKDENETEKKMKIWNDKENLRINDMRVDEGTRQGRVILMKCALKRMREWCS